MDYWCCSLQFSVQTVHHMQAVDFQHCKQNIWFRSKPTLCQLSCYTLKQFWLLNLPWQWVIQGIFYKLLLKLCFSILISIEWKYANNDGFNKINTIFPSLTPVKTAKKTVSCLWHSLFCRTTKSLRWKLLPHAQKYHHPAPILQRPDFFKTLLPI
jgi:hypothetical protein